MNHRDRYACAMSHRQPDRPPYDLDGTTLTSFHEDFLTKLIRYRGLCAESREDALEQILRLYQIDFRRAGELFEPESPLLDYSGRQAGRYVDSWGIERTNTGVYWEITNSSLKNASFDEIKAFPWPDPSQIRQARLDAHAERAKKLYYDTDYVVVAEHPVYGYLELGCWMFGFDDFLYRLAGEPETAEWVFARHHRYVADVCERYYGSLGKYVHLTTSGDDFGTQKGPFLSPGLFNESIAPWYRKRIGCIKGICDISYFHHSCGSVFRLMDGILGMGVDILNPIQPGSFEMEPERLKEKYGDRIVFWGGIDEQNLLSRAKPSEIRDEVREVSGILNKNGGYVLAASHNIQPDVPPENVEAMFRALD